MTDRLGSTTLIVEKNTTGHRLFYVRLLADAAHGRGDRVTIALHEKHREMSEIAIHLNGLPSEIDIIYAEDLSLESVARLSRRMDASTTVVPDGDRFAIHLGVRGQWKGHGTLSILVMREMAQPSSVPGLQYLKSATRLLFFRRASRTPRVALLLLKPITWTGQAEFPVAIDPVTMSASIADVEGLRQQWSLDADRYWFGILGAISARKNPEKVAAALAGLPGEGIGFLIAGKCDDGTLDLMRESLSQLENSGAKIVLIDRLLGDVELDAAVRAVDCVVLAHSNEGSSGLFGKSAAAGTRVVAAGANSLKLDCEEMPVGATWVALDDGSLRSALGDALSSPRPPLVPHLGAEKFVGSLL